jgi:hypothetical protein
MVTASVDWSDRSGRPVRPVGPGSGEVKSRSCFLLEEI